MLESLYITLILAAFFFLIVGIYVGSFNKEKTRLGVTVVFLLLSAVLFTVLALTSQSVTNDFCKNQVTQTVVSGSVTTYSNELSCITQRYSLGYLGGIFSFMVIFNIVMMGVYVILNKKRRNE